MKTLYIIGKDALIWVIKTNHHTVSIVVHTENILIQRFVLVADETGYTVTIIQCAYEWSVTRTGIGSDQTFSRQDIKDSVKFFWLRGLGN